MEQTMIKTENVSKRFGSFALQDIHFELPAGYICGLIGENGVGKTTLLNILAGLYEYDGTISIQEKKYRTNQMELQQDIGFVFHEEWFDDWDSLIANSRHYGKYYKNYDETLLKEYLKRFRLDGKKKYKKLSKGEKLKFATVYKGNIIKNLIMDCQSYTKYRPNETTGGIFVSWRRKEELPTGA